MALTLKKSIGFPCVKARRMVHVRCLPPQSDGNPVPTPPTPSPLHEPHLADKIRVVEVAAGRLAVGGLLGTSLVGNFTGKSVLEQAVDEKYLILIFILLVLKVTLTEDSIKNGFSEDKTRLELNSTRLGMVAMTFIAGLQLFMH